jgi:hypothetical protein
MMRRFMDLRVWKVLLSLVPSWMQWLVAADICLLGFIFFVSPAILRSQEAKKVEATKSAMSEDTEGLVKAADKQLADGWRLVAESYLSQRQLGAVDEWARSAEAAGSGWNNFLLAANVSRLVRETVASKLTNILPPNYDETVEAMKCDQRIAFLFDLEDARNNLYQCDHQLHRLQSVDEIRELYRDVKKCKDSLSWWIRKGMPHQTKLVRIEIRTLC